MRWLKKKEVSRHYVSPMETSFKKVKEMVAGFLFYRHLTGAGMTLRWVIINELLFWMVTLNS